MIYAIDGDKIQSMTSNKAFLNAFKRSGNIYHEDFLTYDFKMKFDLVVGNPPFSKGNKLLYPLFFEKSLDMADKVIMIMPLQIDSSYGQLKKVNKLIKTHSFNISENISKHFNIGVGDVRCIHASRHHLNKDDISTSVERYQEILPNRERLKPRRGPEDISSGKNKDPNGIPCVISIHRGDKIVWDTVKSEVFETSRMGVDSPWVVLVNDAPANGQFNKVFMRNENLKWGKSIFAFGVDSEEEAKQLCEWISTETFKEEVRKIQKLNNAYSMSISRFNRLPSYH